MAIEAFRIATRHMTPVFFLSDGYLGNGAEPWRVPGMDDLPKFEVRFRTEKEGFFPYLRDPKTLARPWAVPGTPGLEHRIGGPERAAVTGTATYAARKHEKTVRLPAERR